MKKFFLLPLLALLSIYSWAEVRYVTDEFRVPLRKSPCARCGILIGGIKTGAKLTFLDEVHPEGEQEKWTKVKTIKGTEGWMPSQYLETQPIAKIRLQRSAAELEQLRQKHSQLKESLGSADQASQTMSADIEQLTSANRELTEELARIKQVSGNALALQSQNQELLKRNRLLQSEVDVLSASNEQLKSRERQTWFLYGGLLIVLGALLSTLLPHLRRRKKFSEWG